MATASRTVGQLITEARQLLNDTIPISGEPRFPDEELVAALNDAYLQLRDKRPDAFLNYGLRKAVPAYLLPRDDELVFTTDDKFYPALLFYVVGRSEITEDTYADNGRAVAMMNKFVNQILSVKS